MPESSQKNVIAARLTELNSALIRQEIKLQELLTAMQTLREELRTLAGNNDSPVTFY